MNNNLLQDFGSILDLKIWLNASAGSTLVVVKYILIYYDLCAALYKFRKLSLKTFIEKKSQANYVILLKPCNFKSFSKVIFNKDCLRLRFSTSFSMNVFNESFLDLYELFKPFTP